MSTIEPIPVVQQYFGTPIAPIVAPIVAQVFTPGQGWRKLGMNKRISRTYARKLKNEGVTSVALNLKGRIADFRVEELLKLDRTPMFCGNLI